MTETSGVLTLTADGDGTVMGWDWQVRPKGWLRTIGPLFGPLGGRMERRIWAGLKHKLETMATLATSDSDNRPTLHLVT